MYSVLLFSLVVAIWLCEGDGFGLSSASTLVHRSQHRGDMTMKIFDWKKREEFKNLVIPDDYKLSVTTLFPMPGARKRPKRVGRGFSAGQGGSCGRGMRGQNSRSSGGVRPGFEGGQTPLYRRIPKFVGRPHKGHTKTVYELVKLDVLNAMPDGSEVEADLLNSIGLVTKANKGRHLHKVVGGSEPLTAKNLTVRAHAFTASAKAAIEENGGTCTVMSPTRNIPLAEALAERAEIDAVKLAKLKERRKLKAERALLV